MSTMSIYDRCSVNGSFLPCAIYIWPRTGVFCVQENIGATLPSKNPQDKEVSSVLTEL